MRHISIIKVFGERCPDVYRAALSVRGVARFAGFRDFFGRWYIQATIKDLPGTLTRPFSLPVRQAMRRRRPPVPNRRFHQEAAI